MSSQQPMPTLPQAQFSFNVGADAPKMPDRERPHTVEDYEKLEAKYEEMEKKWRAKVQDILGDDEALRQEMYRKQEMAKEFREKFVEAEKVRANVKVQSERLEKRLAEVEEKLAANDKKEANYHELYLKAKKEADVSESLKELNQTLINKIKQLQEEKKGLEAQQSQQNEQKALTSVEYSVLQEANARLKEELQTAQQGLEAASKQQHALAEDLHENDTEVETSIEQRDLADSLSPDESDDEATGTIESPAPVYPYFTTPSPPPPPPPVKLALSGLVSTSIKPISGPVVVDVGVQTFQPEPASPIFGVLFFGFLAAMMVVLMMNTAAEREVWLSANSATQMAFVAMQGESWGLPALEKWIFTVESMLRVNRIMLG